MGVLADAMGFLKSGDLIERDAVGERPEVGRAGREPSLAANYVFDLFLGEGRPQPCNRRPVAQFQNPENGVLRIRDGIEIFKVHIPKKCV